ncbi:hypothetical protein AGMMS49574_04350 [Bacteroidia bacterium]|nr:hypothetical protein AGMMS49574_04350 [Bacteroidia bacterium]
MEKDSKQVFSELKENVLTYAEIRFELLKLSTYEGTGKVIGVLSYVLVLVLLAFFVLLFLFLSAAFFLSDLFHSQGLGFGCISLIYLIMIGIVYANKKKIINKVMNEVLATLTAGEDKNSKKDENTDSIRQTDS